MNTTKTKATTGKVTLEELRARKAAKGTENLYVGLRTWLQGELKGRTKVSLAAASGLSVPMIAALVYGQRRIALHTLVRLAKAVGKEVTVTVGGEVVVGKGE